MAVRGIMQRWENTTYDTTYNPGTIAYNYALIRSCWTPASHAVRITLHNLTDQFANPSGQAAITLGGAATDAAPQYLQVEYQLKRGGLSGPGRILDSVTYPPLPSSWTVVGNVNDAGAVGAPGYITVTRVAPIFLWLRLRITRGDAAARCSDAGQTRIGFQMTPAYAPPNPPPPAALVPSTLVNLPYVDPTVAAFQTYNERYVLLTTFVLLPARLNPWLLSENLPLLVVTAGVPPGSFFGGIGGGGTAGTMEVSYSVAFGESL